jgi:nitrogen fixation protein NifU and related proteins
MDKGSLSLPQVSSQTGETCTCGREELGPYSETVMDHFLNPRNIGTLENPDGMGTCGDPSCGDCLVMHLEIRDRRILQVRYLVLGCAAAIASSSITSVLATGMFLEEAERITDNVIEKALGGLPEAKRHCSLLGATALHRAIADYRSTAGQPGNASAN